VERLSQIYSMLSDKNRLRILKLSGRKPTCICELTHVLGIHQPSLSRHLRKPEKRGIINSRKDGQGHKYFINRKEGEYTKILLESLSGWINEDSLIVEDIKKVDQTCRESLCKKLERIFFQ